MQITRCLDPGMSLVVGTVNGRLVPVSCRAVALHSTDNLANVTVYLPMTTSHETLHNVAATRRIAIAATNPIDHWSVQLKGLAADVRLAREDEALFVRDRFRAFGDILDSLGIPAKLTMNASYWPAFAVDVRVDEVFEQTPGPRAGTRVR